MKLKRLDLNEEPFSSASMVIDEDRKEPKVIAIIIYSSGGNIIYLHDTTYKPEEVMVAGEKYLGETLRANRFKVYECKVKSSLDR